jgi:hypothetical protein
VLFCRELLGRGVLGSRPVSAMNELLATSMVSRGLCDGLATLKSCKVNEYRTRKGFDEGEVFVLRRVQRLAEAYLSSVLRETEVGAPVTAGQWKLQEESVSCCSSSP